MVSLLDVVNAKSQVRLGFYVEDLLVLTMDVLAFMNLVLVLTAYLRNPQL